VSGRGLLEEVVLEPEEVWAWEEEVAEAGWEVPDLVLVLAGSVYVHHVALLLLIKQESPAIK